MFESLKEDGRLNAMQYLMSLLISLVAHTAVLGMLVVVPLVFFSVLQADELVTFLIDPPTVPVPPLPPAAPTTHRPSAKPKVFIGTIGLAPIKIPDGIHPEIEPPETDGTDTIIRGIANLHRGERIESPIIELVVLNTPPDLEPPQPPVRRDPIRVSGKLQEAKLINRVDPVYPKLAIQARVSGVVNLEAVIDEEGTITDLKILNGHPLLTDAALSAVKQWKYMPTMIGGEPVRILATVTVIFRIR
jgi:protein TonB